ncbi:MAG: phenylalanine--tRNA ligase subunit beta [Chitinophagales bacterium]|nr:phenylalanine--tRNA ligase subunit beta [Chitinophagaceae bacterium]MCB9064261.1 phenylalanine--tRNA ligase subunit beta [Chitinophagales bacterium]
MVISYNWIKEYLPEEIAPEKLSEILTSIGLEVEAMEPVEFVKGSLEGLVIGEVLTCEKHPDADRLKVTTVNVGGTEPLHIVCGAANVAAGQKVVVAPVGATVHPMNGEPFPIKKAKIRGEASEGMICAEDEISLGESHDGIMVLPENAVPGTLANKYFDIPAPDLAIHIGLTPNRSDAMSHIGVAKDVAAYMSYHNKKEYKPKYPAIELPAAQSKENKISVEVKNAEACPRYMGITISNIKVGPSPEWLQRRLKAIGSRSINNVVDITNYVLHEWGQPLHAFDADKIAGEKVVVQTLGEGTTFVTLDEEERKLTGNDLMICNDKEGMCIAGVFGGLGSGVTEQTTTVFLECAYFNPAYIRRTSLHYGLRTDAATHFEKGVDVNNLEPALIRATQMICELAGGIVVSDVIDVYPEKLKPVEVTVDYSYINKLSGKEYDVDSVKLLFTSLGFGIVNETAQNITLSVPTNKVDVLLPADIVEEVLRIDGLDKIPMPERLNISLNSPLPNDRSKREKVAERLAGEGFMEIMTNSIVNSKYYPERNDLVKMLNSLSSELDVMRPSMLESGLEVVQYNCNRKNTDLRLFEFGKVYTNNDGRYAEEAILAMFVTGKLQDKQWNAKEQESDIYYLKGLVDSIFGFLGIDKVKYAYADNKSIYSRKKKALCIIEAVDTKKLYDFDIKQPVYFASVRWDACIEAVADNKVEYSEVPKHPAVHRDLAIVLDKAVTYEQVQTVTDKLNVASLEEYGLFDVFESEKLGNDKKSFALNFVFQPKDRTLTDEETDKLMQQLADAYKKELQAQIRE